MNTSTEVVYTVVGMSCDHCRSSVLEEVQEIDGVRTVDLDLTNGRLEVDGADVTREQISSAVKLAGYELDEGVV
jgi:copper chaperone CopZ